LTSQQCNLPPDNWVLLGPPKVLKDKEEDLIFAILQFEFLLFDLKFFDLLRDSMSGQGGGFKKKFLDKAHLSICVVFHIRRQTIL
jgi:hypothetical protein